MPPLKNPPIPRPTLQLLFQLHLLDVVSLFCLEIILQLYMTGLDCCDYTLTFSSTFYFNYLVFVDEMWSIDRPYFFH